MSADKTSMIGKWIVQLQTSLALVQKSPTPRANPEIDSYNRKPFGHPALAGLEDLTHEARSQVINKKSLAQLSHKYGLQPVLRWAPKNVSNPWPLLLFYVYILTSNGYIQPNNLAASGVELVLAHTMYAVIGAIAMEQGGQVANQVARERILNPIGLQTAVS